MRRHGGGWPPGGGGGGVWGGPRMDGWRPLLRLARTARYQCEHGENSDDDQLGAPDGRSHDWMPASRTCLVQAKLPEPAEPRAVLVLGRPDRASFMSFSFTPLASKVTRQ